jgi:hypothetical protein
MRCREDELQPDTDEARDRGGEDEVEDTPKRGAVATDTGRERAPQKDVLDPCAGRGPDRQSRGTEAKCAEAESIGRDMSVSPTATDNPTRTYAMRAGVRVSRSA